MARGPLINREPDYVDLDLDFLPNPSTADINMKRGDEAIKRSIRNLIFTNYYERPFQPDLGGNIRRLLFEQVDSLTAAQLEREISDVIGNFEPRAQVSRVEAIAAPDENKYQIYLEFFIINNLLL